MQFSGTRKCRFGICAIIDRCCMHSRNVPPPVLASCRSLVVVVSRRRSFVLQLRKGWYSY